MLINILKYRYATYAQYNHRLSGIRKPPVITERLFVLYYANERQYYLGIGFPAFIYASFSATY